MKNSHNSSLAKGCTLDELKAKHAKTEPNQPQKLTRLQKSLVRRALKTGAKAGELYGIKADLLKLAIQNGVKLNEPILIDGQLWRLVKPEGRFVPFSDLAIEKAPKFSRAKAEAPVAAAAEA